MQNFKIFRGWTPRFEGRKEGDNVKMGKGAMKSL
jgi:hypothetical protein